MQRRAIAAAAALPQQHRLSLAEPLPEPLLQEARLALSSGPALHAAAEAVLFGDTSCLPPAAASLLRTSDVVSELAMLSTIRSQLRARLAAVPKDEAAVRRALGCPPLPATGDMGRLLLTEEGWRRPLGSAGSASTPGSRQAALEAWCAGQAAVAEALQLNPASLSALDVVNGQVAVLLSADAEAARRAGACGLLAANGFQDEGRSHSREASCMRMPSGAWRLLRFTHASLGAAASMDVPAQAQYSWQPAGPPRSLACWRRRSWLLLSALGMGWRVRLTDSAWAR